MSIKEFYDLDCLFKQEDIIFYYHGDISQELLTSVTYSIKEKIASVSKNFTEQKKILYIFIELAQNIIRYGQEHTSEVLRHSWSSYGSLVLGYDKKGFFCMSGNHVTHDQKEKLASYLMYLSSLSLDELTQLYKQRLRTPDTQSYGGSIGLIDILRQSLQMFEYDFITIDNETEFFTLKICI